MMLRSIFWAGQVKSITLQTWLCALKYSYVEAGKGQTQTVDTKSEAQFTVEINTLTVGGENFWGISGSYWNLKEITACILVGLITIC